MPPNLTTIIKKLSASGPVRFFLIGVMLAILFSPGNLYVDAEKRLQVSRWMWTDEAQVLESDSQFLNHLPGKNGQPMAQFGIGQSLVMLPGDMISGALLGLNMSPQQRKLREMLVYYITFPLISGLALMQARRLSGWFLSDIKRADLATLAFALGTSFLVHSRDSQENMLMDLCVFGGIWHGLRWTKDGTPGQAILMSLFLGFLILIRVSTIAVIFPMTALLGLYALQNHWQPNRQKLIVGIGLIGSILLAFVFLDRLYHWYRFGEFTKTYADYMIEKAKHYGYTGNYPMGNPFWSGIRSFAFDTRKAFYLFDPVIILSAGAVCLPWRGGWQLRGLIIASFSTVLLTAALYAKSDFWHGDTSWGPRHLHIAIMPAVLFGIIAFITYFAERGSPRLKILFYGVFGLGFFVQIIALPLYQELEVEQWKAKYTVTFPPALRVLNLVSRVEGNPQWWGLDCNSNERVAGIQSLPIQFMPFQIAAKMPGSWIGKALIGLWGLVLAGFTLCLGIWFTRLARDGRNSETHANASGR